LRNIPVLVKKIIEKQGKTVFDHTTLMTLGDYSFDFEVVYVLEDPDYNFFADVQQTINFEIIETLRQNKIALAIPSQSLSFNSTGNGNFLREQTRPMQVHVQK
jgi:small-conductance mechanosensitive channel